MNRFEQRKLRLVHKIAIVLPILTFLLLITLLLSGVNSLGNTTLVKQQESLETALSRSISQCYAVEGVYPPSLEYLSEHYGLIYDSDTFFVDYKSLGSNLFPEVTVLRRKK